MKFTPEQIAQLEAAKLRETAEVILLFRSLIEAIEKARQDDGKVSKVEGLLMTVNLVPEAMAAVSGVKEIPAELIDITPEEVQVLADILFPAFSDHPLHQRELINAYIGVAVQLVNVYRIHIDPPKAIPVP